MLWVLLAALTALSDSLKDVFSKRSVARVDEYVVAWSLRFFALAVVAPLALWKGIPTLGDDFWWALGVDSVLNVVATVLYTRALGRSDLSAAVPLMTFTPLFLLLTSPLIVDELPSVVGIAGILLIVAGSYLLNVRERHNGLLAPMRALLRQPGARLMLLVALIFSVTSTIDKIGVRSSSPIFWSLSVTLAMVVALSPMALRRARVPLSSIRPSLVPLVLAGLFAGLVVTLQMSAIELTLVAYVIAIKRTSAVMGVLFGHYLFGEPGLRERLAGAVVMVAGVVLIALG